MKDLNQTIKIVQIIPIETLVATETGSAIDTKVGEDMSYDSALVNIEIGNLGDQTSTKVKVEESDTSAFSVASVAAGGAEVTVTADTSYSMQIARSKRYLRAVITIAGGSTPSAEAFVGGILWNATIPFPIA